MKEIIVICDSNPLYARRLSDFFVHNMKTYSDVRVFSSVEILISSLNGMRISCLIADEACLKKLYEADFTSLLQCEEIVLLTEGEDKGNSDEISEGAGAYCNIRIIRFQSAEEIYKKIFTRRDGIFVHGIKNDNREDDDNKENDEIKSDGAKSQKLSVKNLVQNRLIRLGNINDNETLKIIDECIEESDIRVKSNEKRKLRNSVFYSIRGLDVLEELTSDESITEIMVNGENKIFYEKAGRLVNSGKSFDSREQLRDIIQKIVSGANRVVNMSSPIVDARLEDGSRVNVVLEPVSLEGPILTIRRFPTDPLTAEKLISIGAVSEEIMLFLRKLVYAGYNILVSGGTGSGKTTMLNILSGFVPKDERIITIEDSAELKILGIENLVRLEARNSGPDGCQEISIRDLIKSALRMRPDRIIVGEVRGDEAIDMVQAFSVGADGSMSTIHSNSAEDAIYRLEMLMMLGSIDMPVGAIRRQISIGVDIIVQLGRLKDKSRKLLEIREVTGYLDGEIRTSLLYSFEAGKFIKHNDLSKTYKLEKSSWI